MINMVGLTGYEHEKLSSMGNGGMNFLDVECQPGPCKRS